MLRLTFYLLFTLFVSSCLCAEETTEALYLKLLLRKETQIGDLNQKIKALERDVSETNALLRELLEKKGIDYKIAKKVRHFGAERSTNNAKTYRVKDGKIEPYVHHASAESEMSLLASADPRGNLVGWVPRSNQIVPAAESERQKLDYKTGFFGEIAPFYARRNISQLPIATSVTAAANPGVIRSFSFGDTFNPGLKLAFGYAAPDQWQYRLEGAFYWDESKISATRNGTNRFVPSNMIGISQAFNADLYQFSNLSAENSADLYQCHLLVGKELSIAEKGILAPFGGISFAHLKQDQQLKLFNDDLSNIFDANTKQTFTGVGPMIGVKGQYKVFNDIFLFGKSAIASFFGENDLKFNGGVSVAAAPNQNRQKRASKNEFDTYFYTSNEIGLGWDFPWNEHAGFGVKLSYFFDSWFNLDQRFTYDIGFSDAISPDGVNKRNLTLDGVKLNVIGYW